MGKGLGQGPLQRCWGPGWRPHCILAFQEMQAGPQCQLLHRILIRGMFHLNPDFETVPLLCPVIGLRWSLGVLPLWNW